MRIDPKTADRLFTRAMNILENSGLGFGEPILWHLALRHDPEGLVELARRLDSSGRAADAWSASGLNRRAWRAGSARAAYNEAMTCFNRRDMSGYRHWLKRAALAGDQDAANQHRRFESRLSHGIARKIGKHRPRLIYEGYHSDREVERRRSAMLGR